MGLEAVGEGTHYGGNGPATLVGAWDATFGRGQKLFELTNHLGNVLATVTDRLVPVPDASNTMIDYNLPDVASATDYAPFGWHSPAAPTTPGTSTGTGSTGRKNLTSLVQG